MRRRGGRQRHTPSKRSRSRASIEAPYYRAWAAILVSYALALEQPGEEQIGRLRDSITEFKASSARLRLPYYLALLAQVCGKAGRVEEGLAAIDEALAEARTHNERWWDAELHRLRGEFLLMHGADSVRCRSGVPPRDRDRTRTARQIVRTPRDDEPGAVVERPASRGRARRRLEDVYGWFTEGFETPDLRAAQLLLTHL